MFTSKIPTIIGCLCALVAPCITSPILSTSASHLVARNSTYTVDVIYEFPKGTWVENLAVRWNDQILATFLSAPHILQVDPTGARAPIPIHQFPNATGVLGIVEAFPDIFYVVTGNFSLTTFISAPGSYSVWKVDMNTFVDGLSPALVIKVADFPEAVFLNGAATLELPGLVILADAGLGAVWRLNVLTGAVDKVIQDATMAPTSFPAIGINGLKVRGNNLFFSNTNTANLVSVPISPDGTAAGTAQVVASHLTGVDDFMFDEAGDIFLAMGTANELEKIMAGQSTGSILVGSPSDMSTLAGATACQFGRSFADWQSLYISSTGGIAGYIGGQFKVGGRISRVNVGV